MQNLTFLKLGGSVITDKRGQEAADLPVITGLIEELQAVWSSEASCPLLLGHGSGSFGHVYAARYGVHRGLAPTADWMGFALTAAAALRLNRIVVDALLAAGIPAMSFQPSAALQSHNSIVAHWQTDALHHALAHGLVPVVHGDVAFDTDQGSAIVSTESLFAYLALQHELQPQRIVLVGEDAVYNADPRIDPEAQPVPLITSANIDQVLGVAGGSHAVDVTGGMRSKLELMWRLIQAVPGLEVYLIGPVPGRLSAALRGDAVDFGTIMRQ